MAQGFARPSPRRGPYGTSVWDIRQELMQELTILLDPETPNGKDWKLLADWLGIRSNIIHYLQSSKLQTSKVIWEIYAKMHEDPSVEEIVYALHHIGRYDARDKVLEYFKDIILENLLRDGPPRANANCKEIKQQTDAAQQHQEPCSSDCSLYEDENGEMSCTDESVDGIDAEKSVTFRRPLTEFLYPPIDKGYAPNHSPLSHRSHIPYEGQNCHPDNHLSGHHTNHLNRNGYPDSHYSGHPYNYSVRNGHNDNGGLYSNNIYRDTPHIDTGAASSVNSRLVCNDVQVDIHVSPNVSPRRTPQSGHDGHCASPCRSGSCQKDPVAYENGFHEAPILTDNRNQSWNDGQYLHQLSRQYDSSHYEDSRIDHDRSIPLNLSRDGHQTNSNCYQFENPMHSANRTPPPSQGGQNGMHSLEGLIHQNHTHPANHGPIHANQGHINSANQGGHIHSVNHGNQGHIHSANHGNQSHVNSANQGGHIHSVNHGNQGRTHSAYHGNQSYVNSANQGGHIHSAHHGNQGHIHSANPDHQQPQAFRPRGRNMNNSYRPGQQYSFPSTAYKDVRVRGAQVTYGNGSGGSPMNVSGYFNSEARQRQTLLQSHNGGAVAREMSPSSLRSNSWPGSQNSLVEELSSDFLEMRLRSSDPIMQRGPFLQVRRPYVFLTYVNDRKSTIKRVTDCADCLKKNEFKISVDMFESELVGPDMDANWLNQRLDKAEFILVVISKDYRRIVEGGDLPAEQQHGATHAQHIYQMTLREGVNNNRRIVLLLFPNVDPDSHIPPRLRELASATFRWPQNWKDTLYYLVWPEQIVNEPNTHYSSGSSSTDGEGRYSIGQNGAGRNGGQNGGARNGGAHYSGTQNGGIQNGALQNGNTHNGGMQNGVMQNAVAQTRLNGGMKNGGRAAYNNNNNQQHVRKTDNQQLRMQNHLLNQPHNQSRNNVLPNGSLHGTSNHKRSLEESIGSPSGAQKQQCIQKDLLEEQIRRGKPVGTQNDASEPLIVLSENGRS